MNKADKDKVIAALTIGMSWAAAGKSDSAVTFCDEAISIMRGLAEDADLLALFATSQKQLPLDAVISATPPQAQSSHAPNPSNINSLEAKTPDLVTPQAAQTEAQEREAFEAFMLTKYPAHLCHWVGDQYSEMFTRLVFVGWKAGRARSKP